MPTTTDIKFPGSAASIGTDIGDGVNYASVSSAQTDRILEGTTSSQTFCAVTSTPSGFLLKGFFSNEIPLTATILGIEFVAGVSDVPTNGRISSAGSSGGTFDVECYFHNGTSYSSKLVWVGGAQTGITLNGDSTTATYSGGNRTYINNDSNVETLFGAADSLSGLSFNPANQSDFGFAITFQNESSNMVAGLTRGVGMRVTYQVGATAEKVNSIISGSIAKLDTVVGNTIARFNGLILVGATPPSTFSKIYQFEDQTTQENQNAIWSPSNTAADWVNGVSAVTDAEGATGTNWGKTAGLQVRGWNCGQDGTGSTGTGPNGGVDPTDGSHDTSSDGDRYIYCEATTGTGGVGSSLAANARTWVTRMPGFNFSSEMLSTSNDLNLKFWLHAFGSNIGDLFIYIDTNTTSNHSTATLIQSYTSFSGYTANSSVWQQQTVSLNSYRAVDATHYIYFVYEGATGFRADLAMDAVELIEG